MLVLTGIFAAIVTICSWITVPLPFTQVPINLAVLGVLLAGGCLGSKYGSLSILIYILLGAVGIPVFAGFGAGLGTLAGPTGGYIVGYILCAAIAGLGNCSLGTARRARGAAPAPAPGSWAGAGAGCAPTEASAPSTSAEALSACTASSGSAQQTQGGAAAAPRAQSSDPAIQNPASATRTTRRNRPVCLALCMLLGVAACYALGTLWYAHLMQTTIWAALVLCVIPFIPCDALKIAAAVFLVTRLRHLLP